MSANNWRVCPRCRRRAAEEQARLRDLAEASYGRVPATEYLELLREADGGPELKPTLREDWQLGTSEGGEFFVSYRGYCERCCFGHTFKHARQLDLSETGEGR